MREWATIVVLCSPAEMDVTGASCDGAIVIESGLGMILSLIEAVDFIRTVEGSTGIHDGDIRVRIPTPAVDDQHDPRGMSECGAFIRAHPEIGSPYGAHLVGIQTGWLRDHGFLLVKRIESLLNMLDSYIVSTDRGLKGH